MASYHFNTIEKNWQKFWAEQQTFKAENNSKLPKYYALDMFPYPSGAGLHVGHPLGYIASDIVSRYKRHNGYNVLHPMGYDAFGLPAEQYAIQTGQHPAITTEENIKRYREQLDNIGFSFDWSREVRTTNPDYYRWTQWIFLQLFNAWYNKQSDKAEPISELINTFETIGNKGVKAACEETVLFDAAQWKAFSEKEQQKILLNYRLAFLSETMVNWCPELGTVLANDEVKDGLSERGGYLVERKLMTQWSLRISAYAERLLQGLDTIDWTDSIKEAQRNWIGKSEGTSLHFALAKGENSIEVFTTRPDTIFGVSFLTLAPEHELVAKITTDDCKASVDNYVTISKNRSERDRMADVKTISGVFTGAYAVHPFTGTPLPIWIGDYVLAGYGTGAVMAVPAHDSRDYAFAKYFNLPIPQVVEGGNVAVESYDAKEGKLINSDFLNGLEVKAAIKKAIEKIESDGLGSGKTNNRLRNAVFGRQRYWGEPIPIYYKDGIPCAVDEQDLDKIILPEVDKFLPTETGEPPLARAANWTYKGYPLENTTMPGWAGSSWYYLRYMDPHNAAEFVSKEAVDYWQNIDLYIGGSEHSVGHLLYARFWCKFLKDIGKVPFEEPFKKLVNQGMIQGTICSTFIYSYQVKDNFETQHLFKVAFSFDLHEKIKNKNISNHDLLNHIKQYHSNSIVEISNVIFHHEVNVPFEFFASGNFDDFTGLSKWLNNTGNSVNQIISGENLKFSVKTETGKMSKRWYNVVNPDDICQQYGADTLRMYEMFLGPLQDAKPWSTQGIEGVHRFLKKAWRLFHNNANEDFEISEDAATKAELKILHKTIKKATEDIENFSFNTSVSAFMVCVNELQDLKCNKREILESFIILLSPYAPHICEELWKLCGHTESIEKSTWPVFNPDYLIENEFNYPISFNGKVRFNLNFALDMDLKEVEAQVIANEQTQQYLEGKTPKKVIVVKGRIVNVVV